MKSQNQEILEYLKTGKSITQRYASRWLDCDRLSARINELRARRWNIVTVMEKKRKRRSGAVCRYATYKLLEPWVR